MGARKRSRRVESTDPFVGREVIGQYRIVDRLGAGGMGTVYLAEQITMGRRAVLKVLHPRLQGSPDMAARFATEAKAAASLQHPNIVTIFNYGAMEDGTLFLAMEYLEGQMLEDVIGGPRARRVPVERAIPIALQIASALAEAHRRGVVHRDLKPSNVMIVERAGMPEFVKVLDFGIAKLEGSALTSTGEVFGTPRYMSPEQLRGRPLDGRSDIYALGLIVYELLAGRSPFESDTPQGWMFKHIDEAPPRPTERNRRIKLAPAVEDVILRALAKDPAARFESMDAFAAALDAAWRAPAALALVPDATAPAPKPKRGRKKKAAATAAPMAWLAPKPAPPRSLFARVFRRAEQPTGWRGFVASTRGRLALGGIALAIATVVIAVLASGDAPTAAAATTPPTSAAELAVPAPAPAPAPTPTRSPGTTTKRTSTKATKKGSAR